MHQFYTTYEAAHLLGVSLPTVVNWITGRRLKAHRTPGGHRRIAREDLAAFMVRHAMPLPPELSGAVQAQRKALVIADPGLEREGVAQQLADAGFAVEQAMAGFPAGAAAARLQPDLVVLRASDPDGGATLRALRADRETGQVPVIAVGPPEWHPQLLAAGCARALAPPLLDGALGHAAEDSMSVVAALSRRRRA